MNLKNFNEISPRRWGKKARSEQSSQNCLQLALLSSSHKLALNVNCLTLNPSVSVKYFSCCITQRGGGGLSQVFLPFSPDLRPLSPRSWAPWPLEHLAGALPPRPETLVHVPYMSVKWISWWARDKELSPYEMCPTSEIPAAAGAAKKEQEQEQQ